jgi:hypothetical protein
MLTLAQATRTHMSSQAQAHDSLTSALSCCPLVVNGTHAQLDAVEEEASRAILEIQRKTAQIQRPLYAERDAVARRVDGFWLSAMLGCPPLAAVSTAPRIPVLELMGHGRGCEV